jgi:xylulokinase
MIRGGSDGLIVAFDLGTTGVKATVYTVTGDLVAHARGGYTTQRPSPGAAEQDPRAWWRAACACCRTLSKSVPKLADRVAAVGLSGMMNGCVLVDARGRPVRPAVIHADTRCADIVGGLASVIDPQACYLRTGCQLAPYFSLAKLAWLCEQEPETIARARWCIQAKDYLAGRLTGVWGVTDPSDASLTGLYSVAEGRWADDIGECAGIPVRLLPSVTESCSVVGYVTPQASLSTGLRAGTPVVLGGGDGACATLGSGAYRSKDAYHYLGGTSWIAVITDDYVPDQQMRTSHLLGLMPGMHVNYGTVQSAGTSVEWFLTEIGFGSMVSPRRRLAALQPLAASSPPGARGLLFLPYLEGERAPIWDASARAAFIGLTRGHRRCDLARSVLEGVAHALNHVLATFEERGLAPDVIRVLGGGMNSRLWRSIFAGIYGRPLHVLDRPEFCTACGAAMAAACALGACRDAGEAVTRFVRVADIEYPDPDTLSIYSEAQRRFRALYPALLRGGFGAPSG